MFFFEIDFSYKNIWSVRKYKDDNKGKYKDNNT